MAILSNKPKISRGFKDFSFSFKKHPITNDLITISNEAAIKTSVINLVRTKLGSKFFQPEVGTTVEDSLFELANSEIIFKIENEINQVLRNYEPRIFVENIEIDVSDDDLELEVSISYLIIGIESVSQTVSMILKPTRA
ncbi:baseplate wedge subunit [Synechococcus phage DSL-LC03]|nr:baseplate wedge subunit [Synechococcus phage DSL-LC03]